MTVNPVWYSYENVTNLKNSINILMLQATAVLVVGIIFAAVKYKMSNELMLHICFSTIGYGLLMTESILLFNGNNFFGKQLTKQHTILIHGVFIGLGSALAIIGISFEIKETNDSPFPHFHGTHAMTGLIAMILTVIAVFGGILAAKVQSISTYLTFIKPIWWRICHNFFGQAAYVIGMCSLCYGFETWWFQRVVIWEYRLVGIILGVIITVWTVSGSMYTLIRYIRTALK